MKIVVLMKQTFDTEEKIVLAAGGVDDSQAKFVINPYDEYALEEAIQQRDKLGGQVIAVTCGPDRAQEALRLALAIGADEAIRLDNGKLPEDSAAIGAALAALVRRLKPDLVMAGLFAIDSGSGSVALQAAQHLGLPHASAAVKVSLLTAVEYAALPDAGAYPSIASEGVSYFALIDRDIEGDTETVSVPLPALITAQQGLNDPRYPSLPGIMKAKRKPLHTVTIDELIGNGELDPSAVLPQTVRTELTPPPPRGVGKRISGDPSEQASQLVSLLASEAKVLKES